jgi:hypothetical protein
MLNELTNEELTLLRQLVAKELNKNYRDYQAAQNNDSFPDLLKRAVSNLYDTEQTRWNNLHNKLVPPTEAVLIADTVAVPAEASAPETTS